MPLEQDEVAGFKGGDYYTSKIEDEILTAVLAEADDANPHPLMKGPLVLVDEDGAGGFTSTTADNAILVSSLELPHTVIGKFEAVPTTMSFEVEIVRHFEHAPDSNDMTREVKGSELIGHDSVFGLMKNHEINKVTPEDTKMPDIPVWRRPAILTAEDVDNYDWLKDRKLEGFGDIIKKVAPKVVDFLVDRLL